MIVTNISSKDCEGYSAKPPASRRSPPAQPYPMSMRETARSLCMASSARASGKTAVVEYEGRYGQLCALPGHTTTVLEFGAMCLRQGCIAVYGVRTGKTVRFGRFGQVGAKRGE
eukprot:668379-Pleurochrysis_carterae.AAC.1